MGCSGLYLIFYCLYLPGKLSGRLWINSAEIQKLSGVIHSIAANGETGF